MMLKVRTIYENPSEAVTPIHATHVYVYGSD